MEGMNPDKQIRLSKSCIGEAEKLAVMGVLDREFLGMGAEVQQFEQALTEFFGRPTVCVVNGTAALQLALQACDIGLGDEVLVQSLTYVASFQAISATGAVPVACDIDPATMTLDWHDAEKRLTSKTKALMPVHYSGGVGALDEIYAFANKHNLRVIEDAAHSFGCSRNGRKVGAIGDISCFSFDGIKNITSGEGGAVVTGDQDVAQKINRVKPALIHNIMIPSLLGPGGKMSASDEKSTIYTTDTPEQVKKKINKYAFSGGQPDIDEHRKIGGDPDIDVSYQYLRIFFEPDDDKLKKIYEDYKSGKMLTGELKGILIEKINEFLSTHQQKREEAKKNIDNFLMQD